MISQRENTIAVALSQLGVHEGPGPQGHGNVQKYTLWLGGFYAAWCNAFVSWCAFQAGVRFPGSDYDQRGWAYVPNCAAFFKRHGLYMALPTRGDWGVLAGEVHITLIEFVDAQGIHTIEGNEGDQVEQRVRPLSDFEGFCAVPYAADVSDYQEDDDEMAFQPVMCLPNMVTPVPLPPPNGGASGQRGTPGQPDYKPGYADPVYISAAVDCWGGLPVHARIYVWPHGTGDVLEDVELPTGRTVVAEARPGAQFVSVLNKEPAGGRLIGIVFEWARPQ